jgi:hypothetical protein
MQVNPPGLPGIGDGPPPPQTTEVGDVGRCGCDPFLRLSWVVLITNTVQNLLCLARANYRHQQFDVTAFLVSTQWRYLRTSRHSTLEDALRGVDRDRTRRQRHGHQLS